MHKIMNMILVAKTKLTKISKISPMHDAALDAFADEVLLSHRCHIMYLQYTVDNRRSLNDNRRLQVSPLPRRKNNG